SIFSIAKKTGLSLKEIKKRNRLRADKLRIGQKLALSSPVKTKEIATRGVAKNVVVTKVAASEGESEDDGNNDDGDLSPEDNGLELGKDEEANADLEPLGKWTSPDERTLFVRVVKGFLGTPYRFGGSSIRGLDCSAFVKKIYQVFGINLPRTASEQSHVGKRVARDELEVGDLVFFHTRRAIGHVGIYVGNNDFIHASSKNKEVRLDSLGSSYYDKRFIRAVRLKGLDGEV
ncbi:MAG: NlpC/P60 family protein, partial [Syntrophales bacterium]|nr:NlpC/P60 family protein [Syntrophales bacterium]